MNIYFFKSRSKSNKINCHILEVISKWSIGNHTSYIPHFLLLGSKESGQTCLPVGREKSSQKNPTCPLGWRFPVFWRDLAPPWLYTFGLPIILIPLCSNYLMDMNLNFKMDSKIIDESMWVMVLLRFRQRRNLPPGFEILLVPFLLKKRNRKKISQAQKEIKKQNWIFIFSNPEAKAIKPIVRN